MIDFFSSIGAFFISHWKFIVKELAVPLLVAFAGTAVGALLAFHSERRHRAEQRQDEWVASVRAAFAALDSMSDYVSAIRNTWISGMEKRRARLPPNAPDWVVLGNAANPWSQYELIDFKTLSFVYRLRNPHAIRALFAAQSTFLNYVAAVEQRQELWREKIDPFHLPADPRVDLDSLVAEKLGDSTLGYMKLTTHRILDFHDVHASLCRGRIVLFLAMSKLLPQEFAPDARSPEEQLNSCMRQVGLGTQAPQQPATSP